jgi:hypothetical protein
MPRLVLLSSEHELRVPHATRVLMVSWMRDALGLDAMLVMSVSKAGVFAVASSGASLELDDDASLDCWPAAPPPSDPAPLAFASVVVASPALASGARSPEGALLLDVEQAKRVAKTTHRARIPSAAFMMRGTLLRWPPA